MNWHGSGFKDLPSKISPFIGRFPDEIKNAGEKPGKSEGTPQE